MASWFNPAAAIRISAVLAILVGAVYAEGLYLGLRAGAWQAGTWGVLLVGALVPIVPGVLALMGRMPVLLLATWGWVLGVHLPKLLIPRPQIPAAMLAMMAQHGANAFAGGPDYPGMVMVATAVAGIALVLFAQRQQHAG
jgi:hypothetical protein